MHDDGKTIKELWDDGKILIAIGRNPPPVRVTELHESGSPYCPVCGLPAGWPLLFLRPLAKAYNLNVGRGLWHYKSHPVHFTKPCAACGVPLTFTAQLLVI